MTKYSDIEIQTAKNLLGKGFKWIVRYKNGDVAAFSENPNKKGIFWLGTDSVRIVPVSGRFTPLFQSIKWEDNDPVSLESIVHPQILDDVERKYLSAVIKPFRKSVISIEKSTVYGEGEAICIDTEKRYMVFPPFEEGTMYEGMEVGREYTLEEARAMNNAEWLVQKHISAYELLHDDNFINSLGYEAVFDVNRAFIKWLDEEHKEPILDDAEKRYLSAVIRPFRDRVKFLKKYKGDLNFGPKYECVYGQVRSEFNKDLTFSFDLPAFKPGTMYKGMESGREYTLEELGL